MLALAMVMNTLCCRDTNKPAPIPKSITSIQTAKQSAEQFLADQKGKIVVLLLIVTLLMSCAKVMELFTLIPPPPL